MRTFVDNMLPKMMLLPADHATGPLTPVENVTFDGARRAAILLICGDLTSVTDFDITMNSAATSGGSYSAIQTEESTPADLIFEQIEDGSAFENAITVGELPLFELANKFFQISGTVAGSNAAMTIIGIGYDFDVLPPENAVANAWNTKIGVNARTA